MLRRIALPLLLLPAIALAQPQPRNDVALWGNTTRYRTTSAPEPLSAIQVGVRNRFGYGISVSHFVADRLSLTLSADELRGRARLSERVLGESLDAGPLRLRAYAASAQWHFTPPWVIDLYAGAGAAYMSGGRIDVPASATEEGVAGTIPLRNQVAPLLNAGFALPLTRHVSGGIDLKWAHYRPKIETTPDDPFQSLHLDPLVVSFGIRLHD